MALAEPVVVGRRAEVPPPPPPPPVPGGVVLPAAVPSFFFLLCFLAGMMVRSVSDSIRPPGQSRTYFIGRASLVSSSATCLAWVGVDLPVVMCSSSLQVVSIA